MVNYRSQRKGEKECIQKMHQKIKKDIRKKEEVKGKKENN